MRFTAEFSYTPFSQWGYKLPRLTTSFLPKNSVFKKGRATAPELRNGQTTGSDITIEGKITYAGRGRNRSIDWKRTTITAIALDDDTWQFTGLSLSGKVLRRMERQGKTADEITAYIGRGNDVLIGPGYGDYSTLNGYEGNDLLISRGGIAETLIGGEGSDVFYTQDYSFARFSDFNPAQGDRIELGYFDGFTPLFQSAEPWESGGTLVRYSANRAGFSTGPSFIIPQQTFDPSWVTAVTPAFQAEYPYTLFI